MSEQRDSEARGDDPLTCSKCGGPTKENGRWHPDIGAVYGYELGLAERDPAPDTPEVAERPEKCPTCGGAVDDPGYDEINAGDQTGRDYCPDPFHTPESSDPDRYGETGGGEAPERADDPTDHSEEQAAGAGRESRAAISSEQRNYFAPLHPPVSSEEDRALVRRIKEIIGNADWPPDAGDDAKGAGGGPQRRPSPLRHHGGRALRGGEGRVSAILIVAYALVALAWVPFIARRMHVDDGEYGITLFSALMVAAVWPLVAVAYALHYIGRRILEPAPKERGE